MNDREMWLLIWRGLVSITKAIARRWGFGEYNTGQAVHIQESDSIAGITEK